jgi:hypothetical protein
MLSGVEPFNGQNQNQCEELKKLPNISIKSMFSKPLSGFTMNLLEDCLQYDHMLRMPNNVLFGALKLNTLYDGNYMNLELGKPSASNVLKLSKQENISKFIEIQFDDHIKESIKIKDKRERTFKTCRVSYINIECKKKAAIPKPSPAYFIKGTLEVYDKSNGSWEDLFVGCGEDGIVICEEEKKEPRDEILYSKILVVKARTKDLEFFLKYKKSRKVNVALVFTCDSTEDRDKWVKLINMGVGASE